MRLAFLSTSLLVLTACASGASVSVPAVVVPAPPVTEAGDVDRFALALDSVDTLVAAGNEQAAIDRLTQLLGEPDLSIQQKGSALERRASLRYGAGNDVEGAVRDFDELMLLLGGEGMDADVAPLSVEAQLELEALLEALNSAQLAPSEEFEILFRLGRHQDAADLMLSRNLTPDQPYLLDMFQIGYLCDDETLTGPSYTLLEPNGEETVLRYCDFGK